MTFSDIYQDSTKWLRPVTLFDYAGTQLCKEVLHGNKGLPYDGAQLNCKLEDYKSKIVYKRYKEILFPSNGITDESKFSIWLYTELIKVMFKGEYELLIRDLRNYWERLYYTDNKYMSPLEFQKAWKVLCDMLKRHGFPEPVNEELKKIPDCTKWLNLVTLLDYAGTQLCKEVLHTIEGLPYDGALLYSKLEVYKNKMPHKSFKKILCPSNGITDESKFSITLYITLIKVMFIGKYNCLITDLKEYRRHLCQMPNKCLSESEFEQEWKDLREMLQRHGFVESVEDFKNGNPPSVEEARKMSDSLQKQIPGPTYQLSLNDGTKINLKQGHQIGRGGFGDVYLCVDENTGQKVAMKRVRASVRNLKEKQALQREIEMCKTLIEHERIVNYYGIQYNDESVAIFMEYMEGKSIWDCISTNGALSEKEASRFCRQILEGLVYLHTFKNIIHRDIRCANILLDNNRNCKLADFGGSKELQIIKSTSGCHSMWGTVFWMSPEVIASREYGWKTDIWSLGCTIIEMLTAKRPWPELEEFQTAIFEIGSKPIIPSFPQNISSHCMKVLKDCLQRDPSNRPAAEDLLQYEFVQN